MKKSMYFNYTTGVEVDKKARAIAAAGFDGTELFRYKDDNKEPMAEQYKAAVSAGLSVHAFHAGFGGINDIWLEGERGEAMAAFLDKCICEAAGLGIGVGVVHLSSGNTPPAYNELGLSRYQALCRHGEELGVKIAFENLRKTAYLDYVLEAMPNAGFCFDCGHENIYNGGDGLLEKYGDRLLCMHLHDNNGKQDQHRLPFKGSIDWDRMGRRLQVAKDVCPLTFEVMCGKWRYKSFPKKVMKKALKLEKLID